MKKVVLAIMDGVGISKDSFGNALTNAKTPTLDYLMKNYPTLYIHAHGKYVGLPGDDDMGNSEVGHNAMGCGQIYSQGAKLVNESINSGEIFNSKTWKDAVNYSKNNTMHFIGLLSDGNVHSNINHLFKLIEQAKKDGIKKVRVHILLDGRDVYELSATRYVDMLEKELSKLNSKDFDACIASGGGRMKITMDRYGSDWNMVKLGWDTHVLGIGRGFKSATEAIETYRKEFKEKDQYLDSFVIVDKNNKPVGTIEDNDAVIFFNFRGDRALEISRAFDEKNFDKFNRTRVPKVYYAGMLQYDAEANIPTHYLLEPPKIHDTLTEELIKHNIHEYAVSETQKFGHVTYFWNGNRQDKFSEELETYKLIDSDKVCFDEKPRMQADKITTDIIKAMKSNKYEFLRCNFPNGDMVGHTGNYEATITSLEAIDENIKRLWDAAKELGYTLIITADHGNAEEMITKSSNGNIPKTSHTCNPVPFIIVSDDKDSIKLKTGDFGLANIASTITTLLDIKPNPLWCESMIYNNVNNTYELDDIRIIDNFIDDREFRNYINNVLDEYGYEDIKNEDDRLSDYKDFNDNLISAYKDDDKYIIMTRLSNNLVPLLTIKEFDSVIKRRKNVKGIIITNGRFTSNAISYANKNNILLWDRDKLVDIIRVALKRH